MNETGHFESQALNFEQLLFDGHIMELQIIYLPVMYNLPKLV